jgi:DNA-binding MarR family transcriptional regulator
MEQDQLAHILAQWQATRPDLDTSPMATIGRILLAAERLQARLQVVFARHGLTMGGFDVLASLRRAGPPYQLSPTQLYRELLISSGGITHRLERLEQQGLVERIADPADRRGLLVRLTAAGCRCVDQVLVEHLAHEQTVLAVLTAQEQRAVAQSLAKLLTSLETNTSQPPHSNETE